MNHTVKELESSPEFSQHEINLIKKENKVPQMQMGNLSIADRHSQFQVNAVMRKLTGLRLLSRREI